MSGRHPSQMKLGEAMVAVAAAALVIAVIANPWASNRVSNGGVVVLSLIGRSVGTILLVLFILRLVLARRCPQCGKWTMGRSTLISFSYYRYARCSTCGIRARRNWYGIGGWEDANAREYDYFYDKKRPENPWTQPPGMEDEDLIYSKTHVHLLLNKKHRNPNPPDQQAGP
jgi:hypothetical protein